MQREVIVGQTIFEPRTGNSLLNIQAASLSFECSRHRVIARQCLCYYTAVYEWACSLLTPGNARKRAEDTQPPRYPLVVVRICRSRSDTWKREPDWSAVRPGSIGDKMATRLHLVEYAQGADSKSLTSCYAFSHCTMCLVSFMAS
jgi:hypothetical protein